MKTTRTFANTPPQLTHPYGSPPAPIAVSAMSKSLALAALASDPTIRADLVEAAHGRSAALFVDEPKVSVKFIEMRDGNFFVRVNIEGRRRCVADGTAVYMDRLYGSGRLSVGTEYVANDSMQGFATLMATGEVHRPLAPGNANWRKYVCGDVWTDIVDMAKRNGNKIDRNALLTLASRYAKGPNGRLSPGDQNAFQRAVWANLIPDPIVKDAAQRMINRGELEVARSLLAAA